MASISNHPLDRSRSEERRRSREFPRDLSSAAQARRFVAETLEGWGFSHLAAEARLPASELVTNALVHSGDPIVVVIEADGGRVLVEVHDTSISPPALRDGRFEADSGRGLLLVDALSDRWGFDDHSELAKRVWFELDSPPATGLDAGR